MYNAGKRLKTFGSCHKYSEAKELYEKNLVPKVLFPKLFSWDGRKTDFELVLLGPPEGKHIDHTRDEEGRHVTLKAPGNYTIKRVEEYQVEETFLHKNTNKKYQFKQFAKRFVLNKKGAKVFHVINNKVLLEHFNNEELEVFTLKNNDDAERLVETIKAFCFMNGITDNLYFSVNGKTLRVALYNLIESRTGITKEYMIREATR